MCHRLKKTSLQIVPVTKLHTDVCFAVVKTLKAQVYVVKFGAHRFVS